MAIKKPSLLVTPSFLRSAVSGSRPLTLTFNDVADTNIASTSSFIYDPSNAPLKSTQQLNVDWSKFENHTFFMSAEAKVNLAFDQIINGYPFDGTRAEVESFFERLTGFDRYVFDQFPKFHGQLAFSGTLPGETSPLSGTYIVVKDYAGSLYPELSKTKTGDSILNPKGSTSLSIETQIYLPVTATVGTQVVCQKLSGSNHGFCLYLQPTTSTSSVEARFSVFSGTVSMTVPTTLDKGAFNHVCATLNRDSGVHYLEFFKNSVSVNRSPTRYAIGDMDIDASDFLIGSGSSFALGSTTVTPNQTLSGTLDEFRLFHSVRTPDQQALFAAKSIFSTPDLKLYYRLNEPPPPLSTDSSDSVNAIVIDSSGNALHALVNNFTGSLRQNAANDPLSLVIYEKDETVPVLFPAHEEIIDLNSDLLVSAAAYDQANPNLITRLVPSHYLLEGAAFEGFNEPEGDSNQPYGGSGIPGQGKMGSAQLFLSMLYIWAKFFDEMKLFVDSFSSLNTIDYDSNRSMPNNFLQNAVAQLGFNLPPLLTDSTLEQYINAENIGQEISTSETPLKHVQNELLRRILINLPDVLRSKGTQHSIKAFLRAVGIDPENSVRLREFGGPTVRQLSYARENKQEVGTMVEFVSSSLAVSPFLSASRLEPGFPAPAGTFVQLGSYPPIGISNNVNDGLLTSGSWTVETTIKYAPVHVRSMTNSTQSLARLCVTGSNLTGSVGLLANLLLMSSSVDPKLALYVRPGNAPASPMLLLTMSVPAEGVFDSDRWNVSFGCERNDAIGSRVSSSYFMRLATQNNGDVTVFQSTSSLLQENPRSETNVFRAFDRSTNTNASGTFLVVGSNQTIPSGSGYLFLNSTTAPNEARVTDFNGLMSNLRFWSKALSADEWREHVRNYRSLGVSDPLVHYNFVTSRSGSFEKVRLDSFVKQETRRAIASASLGITGSITFLDFSLHGFHMTGSGFPIDKDCVKGEIIGFSYVSPYFDEASTNEKIRVRSFNKQALVDSVPWASAAPVYEIVRSERPTDDVRFSIEFSLIDALNRDIITMFATLDAIDNALGSPELIFAPDYPDLSNLREVYFNRIKEKLNFKAFFEFFRWFDTSIGTFIEQLVPRKTRFKGTNFTIESHMLERSKLEYLSCEIYLADSDRNRIRDNLLVQLVDGTARKY